MNPRDIWILYTTELRSALRERAIVVNSILMPIFLYPILLWVMFTGFTFIQGINEGFTARIAIVGDAPPTHRALVDSLESRSDVEITEGLGSDEALAGVRAGDLDAVMTFLDADPAGSPLGENFRVDVQYDGSEARSRTARSRIGEEVEAYRSRWMEEEAEARGVGPEQRVLFAVADEDVSTDEDVGAMIMGMLIPLFLTIMVALGCFFPAVDTTAGERERSTWETLMTTGASRQSVITAKYLYVATMGVAAGILNVLAMFVSLGAVMAPLLGDAGGEIAFRIPLLAIPVMIAGAIGLALMLSAAMMILASFARTFKDGQAMVQPVYFVAIFVPLLLGQQTDQTLTPGIAAIPVANVAMMIRDAINGIFLWPYILETLAVDLVVVGICLWVARYILQFEDFLMGSYDGSFWRFIKERVRPGRTKQEPA